MFGNTGASVGVGIDMDKDEFQRRIKNYIDLDLPELVEPDRVATALSNRLFQYVKQPVPPVVGDSPSLQSLLAGERVLLFFSAKWDVSSPGYRDVVVQVAATLGVRAIDVDIDDPVGSGMAKLFEVMNTPCVIDASDRHRRLLGARSRGELVAVFGSDGPPDATE